MSKQKGLSLVEVLVAMTVSALLAAAVLTLFGGGVALARTSMSEIEAHGLARAAVEAIARDVQRAGGALGGARIAWRNGQPVPVIDSVAGVDGVRVDGVRLLIPLGAAIEVDALAGAGRYRGSSRSGLQRGRLVAGVGVPGARPVLLGIVVSLTRTNRITVAWAPAEALVIEQEGEVRALVPVSLREFAAVERDAELQLRRRDFAGRWQPAVDPLAWLRLQYACDLDGDGRVDGPLRTVACGTGVVAVRVSAAARAAFAPEVQAHRWVRLRRPSQTDRV